MAAHIEPMVGRYVHLSLGGRACRVYFEEAGRGIPLLCLHTAGSDGRQFRHLMNDPAVTDHFRVLAFDLPWHGKSTPPAGWQDEEYKLTTVSYVDAVMTFIRVLELERPVVMGCSMGGRIVLQLALEHARDLGGVIGLEAADHQTPWYTPNGSTAPTCTAARSRPRWSQDSSARPLPPSTAGRLSGPTCRAARASSKATSISIARILTFVTGSGASTPPPAPFTF